MGTVPAISPRIAIVPVLATALAAVCLPVTAHAQVRLEAQYTARLSGLPIGNGSWTIDITDGHYTAAASAVTTGLVRLLTGASATGVARGTLLAWRSMASNYSATIKTNDKTDEVQLTVLGGVIRDAKVSPPVGPDPDRVPLTDAHQQGVTDPMTASIMPVQGTADPRGPEACQRVLSVFDGRLRYDVQLIFKRMDTVKADKGYVGAAVVCTGKFIPVGGFNPTKVAIKFLMSTHDIELWLVPLAGTRMMVPFRAQLETPIGLGVIEATQFVATSGKAASRGAKTQ